MATYFKELHIKNKKRKISIKQIILIAGCIQ